MNCVAPDMIDLAVTVCNSMQLDNPYSEEISSSRPRMKQLTYTIHYQMFKRLKLLDDMGNQGERLRFCLDL